MFWPFLFANAIQFQPYVPAYINFPDPAGIFPSVVTKLHSLVQTGLTAKSWQSELALRGLSSFTPIGFMLAHVFFILLVSSFVLISFICFVFEPSGLFTFVFELAHMA